MFSGHFLFLSRFISADTVIQILKNGKTRKSGLVPMSRQENLRIYSWYSLPGLKQNQKHVIRISSLNTRNSFPRYFLGATTKGDSAIKVSGGGGGVGTPRVLSRAVQLIKLLPRAATWSNC